MASIAKIGSSWGALIRRKGHKNLCKSFKVKAQAEAWARQLESEIDPAEIVALTGTLLLKEVIQAYRDLRDSSRLIADTSNEHYMLKHLSEGLGEKRAGGLTPQDLVDFATMRKEEGAGPYTNNMEISKLGTAMRYVGVSMKVVLPDVAGQARPLLAHLGLIGSGGKRERRTNEDELPRIVAHLAEHFGQRYADAVELAVMTAMRRGELCRIMRTASDVNKRLVCIRDRKHPRKKKGMMSGSRCLAAPGTSCSGRCWPMIRKIYGFSRFTRRHYRSTSRPPAMFWASRICTYTTCGMRARRSYSSRATRSSKSPWWPGTKIADICDVILISNLKNSIDLLKRIPCHQKS